MKRRLATALIALTIAGGSTLLLFAATSAASSSHGRSAASTQYTTVTTTFQKPPTAAATLPFTGENVLEVVVAGALLVGSGLALRRRGRGSSNSA